MSVVEVKGLTKNFGNICAVKDLTFQIEKGEILGYLGPNGAGKTTTIRLILGILKPDRGEVRLWGDGVSKEKLSRVGALMEQDGLYNRLSCEENLRYWGEIFRMSRNRIEARIEELLEHMNLSERAKESVKNLSKGMRRKLAIARALMHDPELLVLDEPASGLDPEAQVMIRETLAKLAKEGRTILLSSHNLSDVEKIASVIGIINKGELKFFDRMEKVKKMERGLVRIKVDDIDKTRRAIRNLVENIEIENEWLTVAIKEGIDFSDLISILTSSGVRVEDVMREEKSLEDLYLEVING
ncbi:MAG: ABC transporter ATP-binding protein [archaeon]|nr:ABC transporter ATP-binding protein [archaeon]